jgi:death on curing protein
MTWIWVQEAVVFAVHDRQIAEHGGSEGVRDKGAVLSALARPINRAADEDADAASLAAAYAFGLAKNHGFVDGNKRTAWVVARLFLRLNGAFLRREATDAVHIMESTAAGTTAEGDLAAWFRARISTAVTDN